LSSATNGGIAAAISTPSAIGENAASNAPRPRRRLATRSRHPVVELAVLELRELERQRLVEDHDVDALAELLAQQRAEDAERALHERERDDKPELGADPHHRAGVIVIEVAREIDRIDQPLANVRDARRQ
jgi:hypothetical protein